MSCEIELLAGDCVERMRELADASVDAICTDPPYGIGFMGHDWDQPDHPALRGEGRWRGGGPSIAGSTAMVAGRYDLSASANRSFQEWCEVWGLEAFRVLKPGGHALVFGGTRTYHRLAAGLEDAGFEIRDTLAWMYGSGFPKSLDVSKAIDKAAGAERTEQIGVKPGHEDFAERTDTHSAGGRSDGWERPWRDDPEAVAASHMRFAPATEDAERWSGWGTALKPAFEPIVVARKPLLGTVAANVQEYGTGALNVDACRVAFVSDEDEDESKEKNRHGDFGTEQGGNDVYGDFSMLAPRENYDPPGRWPANVLLGHSEDCVQVGSREMRGDGHTPRLRPSSMFAANAQPDNEERAWDRETVEVWACVPGCPVRALDEQTGELTSGLLKAGTKRSGPLPTRGGYMGRFPEEATGVDRGGDSGGASRFFYCAKTSRAERSAGLGPDFEERMLRWNVPGDESPGTFQAEGTERNARNHHPTVKPIALMRWLLRLVTPPGGAVLDPFVGSGSTGCAAVLEPCVGRFVGIERDPGYLRIAEARVAFWRDHGEAALDVVRAREQGERRRREVEDAGQLDLFAS